MASAAPPTWLGLGLPWSPQCSVSGTGTHPHWPGSGVWHRRPQPQGCLCAFRSGPQTSGRAPAAVRLRPTADEAGHPAQGPQHLCPGARHGGSGVGKSQARRGTAVWCCLPWRHRPPRSRAAHLATGAQHHWAAAAASGQGPEWGPGAGQGWAGTTAVSLPRGGQPA